MSFRSTPVRSAAVVALAAALTAGGGLVAATQASAATGDLIKNGSFESPALQGNNFAYLETIPSWVRAGDSSPFEIQRGTVGPAQVGQQYLEVDSDATGSGGAYQSVTAVGAQRAYTLTVVYAARPGTDITQNDITIGVLGALQTTLTADGTNDSSPVWKTAVFDIQLPAKKSSVYYADNGPVNGVGMLIDSISLTPSVA